MITIDNRSNAVIFKGNVRETLTKFYGRKFAFVGQVGSGPQNSVYLITYKQIILLKNPTKTWSEESCVTINKFVDLSIVVT